MRAIVAAIVILMAMVACGVEPEITLDLDWSENPFAIKSKLTPEQANGDADVVVSYGAITHMADETRDFIEGTPGMVIGHSFNTVDVVHARRDDKGEYVRTVMVYSDGIDMFDLLDGKSNIASCRFQPSSHPDGWPTFGECDKVN